MHTCIAGLDHVVVTNVKTYDLINDRYKQTWSSYSQETLAYVMR